MRLKPVAEWAQAQSYGVDPTQCQSALMLFDVDIFMLPYSGSAGCIPDSIQKRCIQQDIFRSSSKTPPQDASIFFNIFSLFFNAHLQYALIVLEFGGATFRRASWTSSTFSVTRQPLAWTVLRGLAILGPACKRLFGRDQGQSDLSGVEAGHWSVRRWRGKRSNISHQLTITPCDNLKFNILYQLFLSKYCMGRNWKKQVFSATWGPSGVDRAIDFTPLANNFGYCGPRFVQSVILLASCFLSPCPPLVFLHCLAWMEVMQTAVHLFRIRSFDFIGGNRGVMCLYLRCRFVPWQSIVRRSLGSKGTCLSFAGNAPKEEHLVFTFRDVRGRFWVERRMLSPIPALRLLLSLKPRLQQCHSQSPLVLSQIGRTLLSTQGLNLENTAFQKLVSLTQTLKSMIWCLSFHASRRSYFLCILFCQLSSDCSDCSD